jgi:hypothetical protein
MSRKLALKKLTQSDLTFFRWHFLNHSAGNQKAINLNADVLVDILYPGLQAIADKNNGKILVTLQILGPGLEKELNLARKIIKGGTYKNWRLNGEFIDNPIESPNRFNSLSANDFVLLDFIDENEPKTIRAVLLANSIQEDTGIHAELSNFVGNKSMVAIGTNDLQGIVSKVHPLESHPIYSLLLDEELEDIALGGIEGVKKLRTKPSTREISPETLTSAKLNADKNGKRGEEFINGFLEQQLEGGKIMDFEWTSKRNAISPYDFKVTMLDKSLILIDVKSTSTKMQNPVHISMNELLQICNGGERYDLYRVFEIHDNNAKLILAENISSSLQQVYDALTVFPDGISVDGISVSPNILPFGKKVIKLKL